MSLKEWLRTRFHQGKLRPERARSLVLCASEATGNSFGKAADQALLFLMDQFELLRSKANGYPRKPIAADVWMHGAELTAIADALADAMARHGDPRKEEHASRIAAAMTLQVMGHYPEEVFPRVLRQARCQEAIDRPDLAVTGYQAIVSDYEIMELAYLLDDSEPLDGAGTAILESVMQSAARLAVLRPEERSQLGALGEVIQRRLATATTTDQSEDGPE